MYATLNIFCYITITDTIGNNTWYECFHLIQVRGESVNAESRNNSNVSVADEAYSDL